MLNQQTINSHLAPQVLHQFAQLDHFPKHIFVVALGSNFKPKQQITEALKRLRQCFGNCTLSTAYRSADLINNEQDFINVLACFERSLGLYKTEQHLKHIEQEINQHHSKRCIDLDLLLFGNRTNGKLPRQDIFNYRFIAQPLAELFPKATIPNTSINFATNANQLKQQLRLDPVAM